MLPSFGKGPFPEWRLSLLACHANLDLHMASGQVQKASCLTIPVLLLSRPAHSSFPGVPCCCWGAGCHKPTATWSGHPLSSKKAGGSPWKWLHRFLGYSYSRSCQRDRVGQLGNARVLMSYELWPMGDLSWGVNSPFLPYDALSRALHGFSEDISLVMKLRPSQCPLIFYLPPSMPHKRFGIDKSPYSLLSVYISTFTYILLETRSSPPLKVALLLLEEFCQLKYCSLELSSVFQNVFPSADLYQCSGVPQNQSSYSFPSSNQAQF